MKRGKDFHCWALKGIHTGTILPAAFDTKREVEKWVRHKCIESPLHRNLFTIVRVKFIEVVKT